MHLRLPLKPKLPLRGNERIALAPFILVTEADKARDKRLANVDLQGEFHRFLKKQLEKKTKFEVIETPPEVKLPTQNLTELAKAQELSASVGAPTTAETIVSGSLEFKIEDRSGTRARSTSPHRRPHLLPAGLRRADRFLFDIVFLVLDGRTGEKLLQDEFATSARRQAQRR